MKTVRYSTRIEILNDKGELHSFNDNPAIDYNNGGKEWCKEGVPHRINGPAVDYNDGRKYWFYKGKKIQCSSTEEFLKIINLKAFW